MLIEQAAHELRSNSCAAQRDSHIFETLAYKNGEFWDFSVLGIYKFILGLSVPVWGLSLISVLMSLQIHSWVVRCLRINQNLRFA